MRKREKEQDAITTTIVGGRPPGCGQPVGTIPRGIEVLVKKAAVDAEFRARLLDIRANADDEIALQLEPSEIMMLNAVPREQLEKIIDNTAVKPEHRAALLGKVAAFMLIALGLQTLSCDCNHVGGTRGVQPDRPEATRTYSGGIRPDLEDRVPENVDIEVEEQTPPAPTDEKKSINPTTEKLLLFRTGSPTGEYTVILDEKEMDTGRKELLEELADLKAKVKAMEDDMENGTASEEDIQSLRSMKKKGAITIAGAVAVDITVQDGKTVDAKRKALQAQLATLKAKAKAMEDAMKNGEEYSDPDSLTSMKKRGEISIGDTLAIDVKVVFPEDAHEDDQAKGNADGTAGATHDGKE